MGGWVCHLQFLLVLTSAVILRSKSHRTHYHILLFQIWDSSNLEGQVVIFISPGTGWYWIPFSLPSTTCRAVLEVFKPASTRGWLLLSWCPCCITTWQQSRRKHCFQQFICCCAFTHCRGNLFVSWSLPSNRSTLYNRIVVPIVIFVDIYSELQYCFIWEVTLMQMGVSNQAPVGNWFCWPHLEWPGAALSIDMGGEGGWQINLFLILAYKSIMHLVLLHSLQLKLMLRYLL
jgi:hypothetical protein